MVYIMFLHFYSKTYSAFEGRKSHKFLLGRFFSLFGLLFGTESESSIQHIFAIFFLLEMSYSFHKTPYYSRVVHIAKSLMIL